MNVLQRRRLVAAGDIVMLLFAGLIYSWSLFVTPLETELGWTRSQTSLTFTFCSIANALVALLSAILSKKTGSKRVTQMFAILAFVGFIGASRTQSLWQIYICYGVLCGGSIGAIYNQTLATIVTWFRDKASLMTGVMLMCYGMGSVLLSPLISYLISNFGWRSAFLVLAFIALIIMLLGSFQTRIPTEDEAALLPQDTNLNHSSKNQTSVATSRDYLPQDMIRTKSFWCFMVWNLSIGMIGLTMSGHAAPIAQSIGVAAGSSSIFVSCYSLFNGLGRVTYGILFDKIGRKKCTLAVSVIGICAGLLLSLSCLFANYILLFISFLILGFTFGGGPVCSASIIKELFGEKNYGINLSFGNLAILGSAFAGPYTSGIVYQNWGYLAVALFLTAAAGLSLFFAVALAATKSI